MHISKYIYVSSISLSLSFYLFISNRDCRKLITLAVSHRHFLLLNSYCCFAVGQLELTWKTIKLNYRKVFPLFLNSGDMKKYKKAQQSIQCEKRFVKTDCLSEVLILYNYFFLKRLTLSSFLQILDSISTM